jgi:hypothetical protein
MERSNLLISGLLAVTLTAASPSEEISVRHLQTPLHRFMAASSDSGKTIANVDFSQTVQGDEVTMRLTYRFADGSIDDEATTYRQQSTFRLLRDHHVQKGPFFTRPVDFTIDAADGVATNRTTDRNGRVHIESKRMALPADLANGIVGTLLLNVPENTAPFRVGILTPLEGGRLIRILISADGEQSFQLAGQNLKATVFRIHPELGGIVGFIAMLIGVQPKDVKVWVLQGQKPAVVKIVGQLGGYGPLVTSVLKGTTFGN